MSLFSALAKPGVRIIHEKLNLCKLCDIGDQEFTKFQIRINYFSQNCLQ